MLPVITFLIGSALAYMIGELRERHRWHDEMIVRGYGCYIYTDGEPIFQWFEEDE